MTPPFHLFVINLIVLPFSSFGISLHARAREVAHEGLVINSPSTSENVTHSDASCSTLCGSNVWLLILCIGFFACCIFLYIRTTLYKSSKSDFETEDELNTSLVESRISSFHVSRPHIERKYSIGGGFKQNELKAAFGDPLSGHRLTFISDSPADSIIV